LAPGNAAEVLVVGAGPTGLTLALWLTRLGIRVRVIDRNPEAAPYSRALGVQARTLEFYRQFGGLAEAAVDAGVKVEGANFWTKGRRAAHVPLGDLGEGLTPYPFVLTYAQDQHERLLIERLAELGVAVERESELIAFRQDDRGITATLRNRGTEEACEIAYLAGCDGARSTVRETLGIGFGGGTYSHLFYVADVQAEGPVVDSDIHLELDEADLLAVFPMAGERHIRLVGTIRDDVAGDEKNIGFDDVSRRSMERLHLRVERVNWFSTYRVHHRIADRFRRGRAFLLGDAAHIHSPVGAQGMNTGIGDAVNLAWKLAAVLRGRTTGELLDTFPIERMAFARRLVKTTDRVFTIASKPGPIAERMRTIVMPFLLPRLFRMEAFRRFLFRTLSQIVIRYPQSPLSAGQAGRIRGGDRLPWVRQESGDNFAPLQSLDWQVHVYGTAGESLKSACSRRGVALHAFPWTRSAAKAGLRKDAAYLIRPDGYVALADRAADGAALDAYCARLAITFEEIRTRG
jgi:2-polyprenyl-6-methoxyphenol hydroxylase-like FAD-dependent oxidoreductase